MKKRILGKTGFEISEVGIGTWQVGGKWGEEFNHTTADRILKAAFEKGINFIDTADVYGDRESEKAVGRAVRSTADRIFVATKCGRRLQPHTNERYQPAALRNFVEDSLQNMNMEVLDLIQLHCPPPESYARAEIFGLFEDLKNEGKILNLGVSVETVEEALKAMEYENVTTIQIIFNMFRQRPAEQFFSRAKEKNVGILARVPLASGLLSGKYSRTTTFGKDDHRTFNREGEAFDKGETFSGVNYDIGLDAVDEIKKLFPNHQSMAALALNWILMFEEISCVIPGASRTEQVYSNVIASELPYFNEDQMKSIRQIYDEYIWPEIKNEKW